MQYLRRVPPQFRIILCKELQGSTMARIVLGLLLCAALVAAAPPQETADSDVNNRPIIGVLAMEVGPTPLAQYGNYTSHIAASYVKFLESSGARVVPIMINKGPSYYRKIVKTVNGIFIPGATSFPVEEEDILLSRGLDVTGSGYAVAGFYLYNLARLENLKGNYLPMWGTCLGFQLMSFLAAGPSLKALGIRVRCSSDNQIIPLEFADDVRSSRLFKHAPEAIMKILREQNVTAHYHNFCVTEETMEKFGLTKNWRVLSTNHDFNGLKFVSTIEAKDIPFYASIYHPEKNGFEWVESENTPHDANAIAMMQYYGDFFVNEARKNKNKFETLEEERAALIYNYNPTYTGDKTVYEQTYLFK